MVQSMTAFASGTGALGDTSWAWELRGVNGRGLDLRLRIPDSVPGLELALRKALQARLARGNIALSLRLTQAEAGAALTLNPDQLKSVLTALGQIEAEGKAAGLEMRATTAAEVLGIRGVIASGSADETDTAAALSKALLADFDAVLGQFVEMRKAEGAALADVVGQQLATIETLVTQAAAAAEARLPEMRENLTSALRRIAEDVTDVDPSRVAQELAVLATKADITEEIDRLRAHVDAARALMAENKPAGRRLDFLAQEFNREANTLCSKSGNAELTAIGLELKAVIEQMREQIQNVE